jgi:hypothetical protein
VTFSAPGRYPAHRHGSRTFERVRCPACSRVIAAFVPFVRFGQELRLPRHSVTPPSPNHAGPRAPRCPAAGCAVVCHGDVWTLDASLD